MKRCTKCIMPETQEKISFDSTGVCSLCSTWQRKQEIDWVAREKQLCLILDKYRGKEQYDCLIPYSGGKDSSYQAYMMVKKYGMRPLLYTFHHTFLTETGQYNMLNTAYKLGIEHLMYTPNKHLVRKLMRLALKENGDWCWFCHSGIYGSSMEIAHRYNIPLVIWGESVAEYRDDYTLDDFEEIDYLNFYRNKQAGIEPVRFVGKERIKWTDMAPFLFPMAVSRSIHLGSYIKWDIPAQVDLLKRELDWRDAPVEGTYRNYDKQECKYVGVRDYCKYLKRGFGRATHQASLDIRDSIITRKEGLRLAEQYDGKRPASLDAFLKEIELSEKEFTDIVLKHKV